MKITVFIYAVMTLLACGNEPIYPTVQTMPKIGDKIDSLNGCYVYYNGRDYTKSQGRSYAKDKYLYGLKGQCVEFVKRYYHDVLDHKMPNVWGHAISFFDKNLPHGKYKYWKKFNAV